MKPKRRLVVWLCAALFVGIFLSARIFAAPTLPVPKDSLWKNIFLVFLPIGSLFLILIFFLLRLKHKLNRTAYYDSVTGEMNLSKFKIEMQRIIRSSSDDTYAVAAIDINRFKSINDLYGYDFGDTILIFIAQKLRCLINTDELFCHGTADKFYLLLKYKDEKQFARRFQSFAKDVETYQFHDILTCKIILSCGLYKIQDKSENITSIIDRANMACKSGRRSHTSSYLVYDQSMYDQMNCAKEIENTMAYALKHEEFALYLQPKFSLDTKCIVGAEALVRWISKEKGVISPSEFIPLFEENGFIIHLDYYVFEEVCKLLKRWRKEGKTLLPLSVNLSRRHLEHADTAHKLSHIAKQHGVPPELIEIELTESAFVDCDSKEIIALLDALHSYGFSISIDDFGSGYSSLALLTDITIDVLKIDKSFLSGTQQKKVKFLLQAIIEMSHKINILTVCEGIETQEQAAILRELGCDVAQGYLFERPLPISTLEEKYQSFFTIGQKRDEIF